MEDIRQRIGERIRKIRKEKEISQEKLAFCSGLNRTYISLVERGESNPSILSLERIAKGLGVNIKELL